MTQSSVSQVRGSESSSIFVLYQLETEEVGCVWFHTSQFIDRILSVITEGENDSTTLTQQGHR